MVELEPSNPGLIGILMSWFYEIILRAALPHTIHGTGIFTYRLV